MYSYTFKRITRSWGLFIAFFLGLTLAVALFAGTIIGSDSIGYQTVKTALTNIPVDVAATRSARTVNSSDVDSALFAISTKVPYVSNVEAMHKMVSISVLDSNKNFTTPFTITAISNNSMLFNDAVFSNVSASLGVDQALIEEGSTNAPNFSPGDKLMLKIGVVTQPQKTSFIYYNLTLNGGVRLTDKVFSITASLQSSLASTLLQQIILGTLSRRPSYSLLIINQKTIFNILSTINSKNLTSTTNIATTLLVWLDHDSVVKPWDIDQSLIDAQRIGSLVSNGVSSRGYSSLVNLLYSMLNGVQNFSNMLRIAFVVLALPVFFTAWYMGRTVSDVSMNLRRREIGLLLTKGFSKGQILRLFIVETLLMSVLAGGLGILIGVAILPLVGLQTSIFEGFQLLDITTIIFVVIFSVVIAVLSVISPARRASSMKVVDATREYAPEESEAKPKIRWPLVALIMGAYKIGAELICFNLQTYTAPRGGLFVVVLFRIAVFTDQILGYVAPVLFFWGFAKIFIQGSFKLQELIGRVSSRVVGDIGEVASKNAKLNVKRTAAVAFLVALIIGYGVSVIGGLASTNDYTQRSIYNNIGADISVVMFSEQNATLVKTQIINLTQVSSATIEMQLPATTSFGAIQIRSINPSEWKNIAYYEPDWFTGASSDDIFNKMAQSNETIILDRSTADFNDLNVGDNVTVVLGSKAYSLTIAGFFGVSQASTSTIISSRPRILQPINLASNSFWSYIPEGLYNQTSGVAVTQTRILVKLASGSNGTQVADQITNLNTNIQRVDSVASQEKLVDNNIILSGPRRVQALGVPFAILTASVGVVLLSTTTLRERKKEITLMAVKGFSLTQVVKAQLLENLGIISFSVLLGVFVGYVTTMGNVQSQNTTVALVMRRVVFPIDAMLNILIIVGIVLASLILPMIIVVMRYTRSLEWRIRG